MVSFDQNGILEKYFVYHVKDSMKRQKSPHDSQPVSYTHLDVYKRQVNLLFANTIVSKWVY